MAESNTSLRAVPRGLIASRLASLSKEKESPDRVALTESLWRLREAAAVLVAVDPATLVPVGGTEDFDERARLEFMADLVPLEGVNDRARWSLSSGIRQSALQRMKSAAPKEIRHRLQQAIAVNSNRPDGDLQTMLEKAIAGQIPEIGSLDRKGLKALATVSNWLAGILDDLPQREILSRAQSFAEFLHPRKQLADELFIGRTDELGRLADHIGALPINLSDGPVGGLLSRTRRLTYSVDERLDGRRNFMFIHGPGGVGKSTLLARFILDHVTQLETALPVVTIDLDRPEVDPLRPMTLLVEGIRQLVQQRFESLRSPLQELNEAILDSIDRQETDALEGIGDETGQFAESFASLIRPQLGDQPLLFVVDTFEEAQYFGPEAELIVFSFLERLASALPNLRVVVVGRAKPSRSGIYLMPIVDLPPPSAVQLLRSIVNAHAGPERPEVDYEGIVSLIGGNPMVLRLAGRLIAINDSRGVQEASTRGWLEQLRVEVLQARLYGRILGHLHKKSENTNIARLAFPGLVVRRIDVGVILDVLAAACRLTVATPAEADGLLALFAKEVALVAVQPDGSLAYRSDIRRVMLESLTETLPKAEIDSIDRLAVELWAGREGPAARAEEIYHRLRLEQSRGILEERWMPEAASYLGGALGEVPDSSRVWLANKLGASLDDKSRVNAVQVDWEQSVAQASRRFLENGRPEGALQLLEERSERLPGSPLYGLQARALYALDQLDEAARVVAEGQRSLADSGDAPDSVELGLLRALIFERSGDLASAREFAERAVEEARLAGVRMPLLRGLLRLLRITRKLKDPAHLIRSLQERTAILANSIAFERIAADSALLSEAAAELGPVAPEICRMALDRIGPDVMSRAPKDLLARVFEKVGGMSVDRVGKIIGGDARELAKLALSIFSSNLASEPEASSLLVEIFREASDGTVRRIRPASQYVAPRVGSKLDAGVISTLVKLISEYFTSDELRAVLRLYLSREAYDIFPSGLPLRQQVAMMLETAEREGWTSQLFEALSDTSKSHEFRAALDSYSRPASAKLIKAFLSHATEDTPAVRDVYQRLLLDGFAPWFDDEDLLPGQDWSREIERAMGASDAVLVFLSKNALAQDGYIQKEIQQAQRIASERPEGSIFIIPVRLDDCEVPDSLRRLHWVNLFEANGYSRLIRALDGRSRNRDRPRLFQPDRRVVSEARDRFKSEGSVPTASYPEEEEKASEAPEHVVVLIHGISDYAVWNESIRPTLERAGFKVVQISYGIYSALQFLVPFSTFRRKAAERFRSDIRLIAIQHPNALISVIAYGFGTSVVTYSMSEGFDLKFHRIIFCRSVAPFDFAFEQVQGRFLPPLLNETTPHDFFPALTESIASGYGATGTFGFRRPLVRDRSHMGLRPSQFLSAGFCDTYWIPFLRSGEVVAGIELQQQPSLLVRLFASVKLRYVLPALLPLALMGVPGFGNFVIALVQRPSAPVDVTERLTGSDTGGNIDIAYPARTITIQAGVYPLNGRDLKLQAKQLVLAGDVTIRSFAEGATAPSGRAGESGSAGGQRNGDGQNGAVGLQGGAGGAGRNGSPGRASGSFRLELGEINGGPLTIIADGEVGGTGGPGGAGGPGGPGGAGRNRGGNAICTNAVSPGNGGAGGRGGTGGPGGQGGRGGDGGRIESPAATANALNGHRVKMLAPPGKGGMGGKAGAGGPPGAGGAAGAGSHCGGGGDAGPQGTAGEPGSEGKSGADGAVGKLSAQ